MSPLQWALLILGGLAIVALWWFSRRDRREMERFDPATGAEPLLPGAKDKQLDIFSGQQFDEFGVGRARRVAPTFETEFEENFEPDPGEDESAQASSPPAPIREKIISLLIAERDGAQIGGRQLHQALARQRLEFGARQIYHRLHKGEVVFSVASLLKPGVLDPEAADSFTTPGLTLFMVLPGPQRPADALRDMVETARSLAKALNSEVYDGKRAPFAPQSERTLAAEVEVWARG